MYTSLARHIVVGCACFLSLLSLSAFLYWTTIYTTSGGCRLRYVDVPLVNATLMGMSPVFQSRLLSTGDVAFRGCAGDTCAVNISTESAFHIQHYRNISGASDDVVFLLFGGHETCSDPHDHDDFIRRLTTMGRVIFVPTPLCGHDDDYMRFSTGATLSRWHSGDKQDPYNGGHARIFRMVGRRVEGAAFFFLLPLRLAMMYSENAVVVGYSGGGTVALFTAAMQRVQSVFAALCCWSETVSNPNSDTVSYAENDSIKELLGIRGAEFHYLAAHLQRGHYHYLLNRKDPSSLLNGATDADAAAYLTGLKHRSAQAGIAFNYRIFAQAGHSLHRRMQDYILQRVQKAWFIT